MYYANFIAKATSNSNYNVKNILTKKQYTSLQNDNKLKNQNDIQSSHALQQFTCFLGISAMHKVE